MYYKLKENLALRGWEKLNTGVLNSKTGNVHFLPKEAYAALLKCNGLWSSDFFLFTAKDRAYFAGLEQAGLVEAYEKQPEPLTKEQSYKQYGNRFIRQVHWSITGRCNYRCRHCYMSAPIGKLGELTLEQCKTIIDGFVDCGIFKVSLTGGEALVHPHFWEIVKYLLANHIQIVQIYSNGFLINESFFAKCAELGIKPEIALSFDGTDGQHEWLRNVPAAEEHLERALQLCQKHGFSTFVEYCLHKGNAHCLRDSINYLDKHGVGGFKLGGLMVKGEGEALAELALSNEELWQTIIDYLPSYKVDQPKMRLMLQGVVLHNGKYTITQCKNVKEANFANYCVCGHARNVMHITAEGKALPCIPFTNAVGLIDKFPNVVELGLKKVLSDSYYMHTTALTLKDYVEHNRECAACSHLLKCAGGCRGLAADQHNAVDCYAKDNAQCYFYKQGVYDKLVDALARCNVAAKS